MWIFMSAFMLHAGIVFWQTRPVHYVVACNHFDAFSSSRGRMPQSLTEHVEIIEAIETGDADKADEISASTL